MEVREQDEVEESATSLARAKVRDYLVPLLDAALERGHGRASVAVLAGIGELLPLLHWLAPEWVLANAMRLLSEGAEKPALQPAWGAYLGRAQLYRATFDALRPWYVKAAEAAVVVKKPPKDNHWSVTRSLAVQVTIAALRGYVSVGDSDHLLEKTFDNVPLPDRSHAYWNIFRGWTDAQESPPPEMVERLVKFWAWRLEVLASKTPSDEVVEEAKALAWFIRTPYLQEEAVLRLGNRTAELSRGQIAAHADWERLIALANVDLDGTFALAERIVAAELRSDHPFIPIDQVKPLLKAALNSGKTETQQRARRLVNRIGERGFTNLSDLLGPSYP
jgi:hypothetical protein